ncbi:hypothetical protein [Actinacidiphila acididurans]|uniref:Cobyrinic acid a,c-diamide synthase n=1 Tax=Actinacidiphila acididurans TaxID=2784346 RepID=A0ABS2TRW0_9ACTN|nr:hypothetical protein [Actinacidiphila acididurans]MBM9506072.1 hypothetical protein [Actinacidiphila acididurans]
MPRRVSLPGADELFRTTGGAALQAPTPRQHTSGEDNGAAQGEARLRPVPDEDDDSRSQGADGEAGPRAAAEAGRDTSTHARRPLTGDRSGVPTAAAGAPTVTATVTPQVPPVTPAVPSQDRPDRAPVPPPITANPQAPAPARRKAPRQNRRPSGRERHDEKITVYVSAEELMDLEHARLVLRGEHGLAIDRGRIVREAVAVVLADLESRGDASILVRRLRGR